MRLDRSNRVMTLVVSAVVLASLSLGLAGAFAGRRASALGTGALLIVVATMFLAWAMSPRELVIDRGELRVERRAWPALRIPLASVSGTSVVDGVGLRAIRVFGVGGFFGSYGLFRNKALGRFRMYATHMGQAMVVRRTGDACPIVLTPDDVAGAVRAVQALQ